VRFYELGSDLLGCTLYTFSFCKLAMLFVSSGFWSYELGSFELVKGLIMKLVPRDDTCFHIEKSWTLNGS